MPDRERDEKPAVADFRHSDLEIRRDKQSEAAPEDPKTEELGGSGEERNRHLRYAHEQYSGSGQGRLGAPKGRNLPLDKPRRKQERYPPGTKMPWPADEAIESEDKGSKPRK